MATPDYTAASVMDAAASLNNDGAKQVYTYAVQLPYIKRAFRELREELQLQNIPITSSVGTLLTIPTGVTEVSFVTTPALPQDLIEIRQLWESPAGLNTWTPMTKVETLPYSLQNASTANFLIYSWQNNHINLLATNQVNDLKIDYIAELTDIVDENTTIGVINGRSFLESRTAALCAQYIGEDKPRADDLNKDAIEARDRLVIIEAKAKQSITTRRRPFRQSWKNRGSW